MRKFPVWIYAAAIFCFITSPDQSLCQSTSMVTSFAGDWKFTFSGTLNGDGTMKVNRDGAILIYLSLGKYQHLFTNPISLRLLESGAVDGDVLLWQVDVGKIAGLFSPDGELYGRVSTPLFNVGVVTGVFTENSGRGTYQSVAGNGTWSALKN